jgi:prepilin-type processing-associated H-X9-DG protein
VNQSGTPSNVVNHTRADYVAQHDGAATTVSISENIDTTSYLVPLNLAYNSPALEPQQCFIWAPITNPPATNAPSFNQGAGLLSGAAPDALHARPSSNHPGGAVVCYADGHNSFIADSINYQVWAMLMTPWGAQSLEAGKYNPPIGNDPNNKFQNQSPPAPLDVNSVPTN